MLPAASDPYSTLYSPIKNLSPIGIVNLFAEVMKENATMNSFQQPINANAAVATIPGRITGVIIVAMMRSLTGFVDHCNLVNFFRNAGNEPLHKQGVKSHLRYDIKQNDGIWRIY